MNIKEQRLYFISRASTKEKLEEWERKSERMYGEVDKEYREAIDKRKSEINGSNHSTIQKGQANP